MDAAAYHEAGHALLAAVLHGADPIEKVTIIARGITGGGLFSLPTRERNLHSKEYLLTQLAILMGGRAAEQTFLGTVTNGAENDIERAHDIAWHMVCKWGMSALGAISAPGMQTDLRTGQASNGPPRVQSEAKRKEIDDAADEFVANAEKTALTLLKKHKEFHEKITSLLLEKETLDGKEIYTIVGDLKGTEKAS